MEKWQNLKKLNRKSASQSTVFKKTCPWTIHPIPFFNLYISSDSLGKGKKDGQLGNSRKTKQGGWGYRISRGIGE